MKYETKRIHLDVVADFHSEIKTFAAKQKMTMKELITKALIKELLEYKKKLVETKNDKNQLP